MGMYQLNSVLAFVLRVHSLRIEQLGCLPGPATAGLDILRVSKQLLSVNP